MWIDAVEHAARADLKQLNLALALLQSLTSVARMTNLVSLDHIEGREDCNINARIRVNCEF